MAFIYGDAKVEVPSELESIEAVAWEVQQDYLKRFGVTATPRSTE